MERNKIYHGNNLDILKTFPDNSIDSIVTDPPYGLGKEPDADALLKDWLEHGYHEVKGKGFMGKEWDAFVPQPIFWKECYRVLKPGGYLLSFAGTRTYDWIVMGLRLSGFEIRDQIAWIYGSGFPKSFDVSKAIESKLINGSGNTKDFHKLDGTHVESSIGYTKSQNEQGARPSDYSDRHDMVIDVNLTTDEAKQWKGYGTALKPAMEPIVMARKKIKDTIIDNLMEYGTGAINIDACRIDFGDEKVPRLNIAYEHKSDNNFGGGHDGRLGKTTSSQENTTTQGRFPANVIHDGSDEVVALFPDTGISSGGRIGNKGSELNMMGTKHEKGNPGFGDSGSAARFFYTPKASQSERNFGLGDFESQETSGGGGRSHEEYTDSEEDQRLKVASGKFGGLKAEKKNIHPTVKPIELMQYLVRMVTPRGALCLDPFLGSGTTAIACKLERIDYIGIEIEKDYVNIAQARVDAEKVQMDIFDFL